MLMIIDISILIDHNGSSRSLLESVIKWSYHVGVREWSEWRRKLHLGFQSNMKFKNQNNSMRSGLNYVIPHLNQQ